jgi:hypothetical protein
MNARCNALGKKKAWTTSRVQQSFFGVSETYSARTAGKRVRKLLLG